MYIWSPESLGLDEVVLFLVVKLSHTNLEFEKQFGHNWELKAVSDVTSPRAYCYRATHFHPIPFSFSFSSFLK